MGIAKVSRPHGQDLFLNQGFHYRHEFPRKNILGNRNGPQRQINCFNQQIGMHSKHFDGILLTMQQSIWQHPPGPFWEEISSLVGSPSTLIDD